MFTDRFGEQYGDRDVLTGMVIPVSGRLKNMGVSICVGGLDFEFSIRQGGKPLLEGGGVLGGITVVMGRYWKSTFLRYLFALLTNDYELAIRTSQILSPGGFARLRVGNALLECRRTEMGADCNITKRTKEEAYLLYEGFLLTLKYGYAPPLSLNVTNAAVRLLRYVGGLKWSGPSSVLLAEALEKALQLDAWLLVDGLLDGMHPDDVFRLAGLASSAGARLVVATHSPWVRRALRCHSAMAEAQGMPAADKLVTAYEFVDGTVKEIDLASEDYGKAFGKLYENCR